MISLTSLAVRVCSSVVEPVVPSEYAAPLPVGSSVQVSCRGGVPGITWLPLSLPPPPRFMSRNRLRLSTVYYSSNPVTATMFCFQIRLEFRS